MKPQLKEQAITNLVNQKSYSALFIVGFEGLKSNDLTNIRRTLNLTKDECFVCKNTQFKLLSIRANSWWLNDDNSLDRLKFFRGMNLFIFSKNYDYILLSRILANLMKTNSAFNIKSLMLSNNLASGVDLFNYIKQLPTLEEAMQLLCSTLLTPQHYLINTLQQLSIIKNS